MTMSTISRLYTIYYEKFVSTWISLVQRQRLIIKLTVIIALLAYFGTNSMFELETERLFSFSEECPDVSIEQTKANSQLGLHSLEQLGDVTSPDIVSVQEKDTPLNVPDTWTESGDGIYSVDGSWWYVSVDTPMPGVTGDMIKRWFSYANCSDKFVWWHPKDHSKGIVMQEEYKSSLQRLNVNISGFGYRVDLILKDPCKTMDCSTSEGVGAVIAGDIVTYHIGFGPVHIGSFVYTLEESTPPTQDTSPEETSSSDETIPEEGPSDPASKYSSPPVLHAKYWLGQAPHATGYSRHSGWLSRQYKKLYDTGIRWTKSWMFTERAASGVYVHTKEKMFVLSKLLVEGFL